MYDILDFEENHSVIEVFVAPLAGIATVLLTQDVEAQILVVFSLSSLDELYQFFRYLLPSSLTCFMLIAASLMNSIPFLKRTTASS